MWCLLLQLTSVFMKQVMSKLVKKNSSAGQRASYLSKTTDQTKCHTQYKVMLLSVYNAHGIMSRLYNKGDYMRNQ